MLSPQVGSRSSALGSLAPLRRLAGALGLGFLLVSCGDDSGLDTTGLFTYDEARPIVSISGPAFTNANVSSTLLQYSIVIDSAVEDQLSASDSDSISVTNGSIAALSVVDSVNLDEYILYLQPDPLATADEIIITVPSGAVNARIGDGYFPNEAASFVIAYDNIAPSVDITVDASMGNAFLSGSSVDDVSNDDYYIVNGDFSLLLSFDEEVTGLTASDIETSLSGVVVSDTVALSSGFTYRVDFELSDSNTLEDNTDIVIALISGAVEDLSGDKTESELSDLNITGYTEIDGYANARTEYLVTLDRSPPTGVVTSVPLATDYTRVADFDLEGQALTESIVPLRSGERLEFVVEFNEGIEVFGSPYIAFGIDSLLDESNSVELEKKASFAALGVSSQGIEDAAATFVYTVESDSNLLDNDGINASINSEISQLIFPSGAYISDKYSNYITDDISLTPAFSLSAINVDTIIPEITDITWSAEGHVYNSDTESGKFSVDEVITFNLSFSEVIYPNSLSESVADYSFTIDLKSGGELTPLAIPGTRHIVEDDISVFQFEFLIEEGYNAADGISYVSVSGPEDLFGDVAGNAISQSLEALVSRTVDEINIFIDAELPELLSIAEVSVPAATSILDADNGIHYYVGANYGAEDAEKVVLRLSFTEEVNVSNIDSSEDAAISLIAYFKDNSDAVTVDNTYSFTYVGAYDELSTTLLFEYEVIPFGESGVTQDDLDGIELDYLLLENASIKDDYGNSVALASSDELNQVYRVSLATDNVNLDFLEKIYIETTPAEVIGISFTGVNNGAEMLTILGEGSLVEVLLTFDQPVEFFYSSGEEALSRPSLALEIVAGTEPILVSDKIVYASHSAPGLGEMAAVHTFTYAIQPDDANATLSSIWLLRNSTLADNGGYDDLMVVAGSSISDQRSRNAQEDFSSDAIDDYIFADDYARHPLIPLETGIESIAYFHRPAGFDSSAEVNDYIIYPLDGTASISFTLAYGANASDLTHVQVQSLDSGAFSELPYLRLYGDLKDDSDADGDGIADSSERWEARAYLSLGASNLQSAADSTYSDLVFVLSESDDPADGFAAQYLFSESVGIIYDSLVIGDSYSITTAQGNPIHTDISNYTYDTDASQTLSAARERVFFDPNPRVLSIVELISSQTESGLESGDKSYNLGEVIKLSVSVSEDVTVSGSGDVRLYLLGSVTDQKLADYYSDASIALDYVSSESTARELVFTYQVASDIYADIVGLDSNVSLRAIETTGTKTIKDLSVAGRELRGFTDRLSLTYSYNVESNIDSRAPRLDSLSISRLSLGDSAAEPVESDETLSLVSGDKLFFTLSFHSESALSSLELDSPFGSPYVGVFAPNGDTAGAGISPRLRLEIDPGEGYSDSDTTRYATYDTHVASSASTQENRSGYYSQHIFTYVITADDHDTSGITIVGPLDSSAGIFQNIPAVDNTFDKNEANYSLHDVLVNLGMDADSAVEEYELSHIVVDNYPTLVGFHIDTPDNAASHTTSDLRFTPDKYTTIQFYAIVNQLNIDEGTAETNPPATLPFSIYDSTTGDIEDFAANYVDWRGYGLGEGDGIEINGIENYHPVSATNYSVFIFNLDLAGASKARNVNADTIIIPENPFQNQSFNPKNARGTSVNLLIGETNITSVLVSDVDKLVVDFRPPEITGIELPPEGLYYHSSDPSSTMSDFRYKVTFSEPVYAANMLQYPNSTPMLYQSIGSGAETNASCANELCVDASSNLSSLFSTEDNVVEFHYAIAASDSGYLNSFYVEGGPNTSSSTINTITDLYGSELDGRTLPASAVDERNLSDSSSMNILVDNFDLFIEAVTLPAAGIYQAGTDINITVEFSREVDLKQSESDDLLPEISFVVGSQTSAYAGGSTAAVFQAPAGQSSNILTFVYAVESSLALDDYDGLELSSTLIDWNGADIQDALRSTEPIDTSAAAMTDLTGSFMSGSADTSAYLSSTVIAGVHIDVVYPAFAVAELKLEENPATAADAFDANDHHYYLNNDLIFGLSFNEPVIVPSVGSEYQSFIEFTYIDTNGTEHERLIRFDPESDLSTLANHGLSWDWDDASSSSSEIYFVYQVGSDDVSSASDSDGFIADGYLKLADFNLSGIVDRSGKSLAINFQPSISPSTAAIDLDKTSIYSYNLFAVDANNIEYDLYSSEVIAGEAGLLTDERYITSGQDLVIEFSFRHHPAEEPSQVVFDLAGNSGLYLAVDIDNVQGDDFFANLQEDTATPPSYSDGTSTLRYFLDLSSYTASKAISDLDGIDISFIDDHADDYRDQSGPVNLAFADVFRSSLDLINVDTQGPSIDSVSMQPSATGLTLYYGDKDELQITVQFSEAVAVSSGTFNDVELNFSLRSSATGAAEPRVAGYLSSSGERSHIFTYVVDETVDGAFDQIYFDTVELVHKDLSISDITTILGDTRASPNPLTSAIRNYAATSAVVQYHALDFDAPSIASLRIPAGSVSSKTIELGGGDALALTMVTSREVAFASDSVPRLRLFADSTPITFHYAGDYNSSAFALSHTFTYTVGSSVETKSTGLYLPADALQTNNAGGFDVANTPLNGDLNISSGSTQFNTGGTAWTANPTEYIFIDSLIPEFAAKYIPPQSLYLEYSDSSAGIEFNSSHIFTLGDGSDFPDALSADFIAGSAPTVVDFTRPFYQATIDGARWYIWSAVADGHYRISTTTASQPWLFSKATDVASIQDVFISGTVTEFGELSSVDNPWYLVSDATTVDFNASAYTPAVDVNATLNQRYLLGETLYTYLVLSEAIEVAEDFADANDYGAYPAYELTYTNAYDGSNSAAELPLTFSHWLETRTDSDAAQHKQVMVYTNSLNASTVNKVGTTVQPARQLAGGAALAIRDLFGNALPINDDNSSINIYQDSASNSLAGIDLKGYEVQLDSVSLYHLSSTSPDVVEPIDPDLTYIIGDQLVLDLSFSSALRESSYEPTSDFHLALRFNDSASKEHILGDGAPGVAGDTDQRYWYSSTADAATGAYDGNLSRADYEADINSTSKNFNDVLRYIFTIGDSETFNSLEEGVAESNLSLVDLNFSTGLVDAYGSAVDTSAVLAALSAVSIPIGIDSIRPQIHLNSTASSGGDYSELAPANTYSRDDYFKYLNGNVSQHPEIITFTLSFTEPIVMPAKSGYVDSGESNFSAGLQFQVQELNGSSGERNAASAYVPYIGTGSAPEYTTTTFTYSVQADDDSDISGVDINATIYDLAGNVNYYSSVDGNGTVTSSFNPLLYGDIALDGRGPKASISVADDVQLYVVKPGGNANAPQSTRDSLPPYGVDTTLYFEVKYDQNIHTNNLSGAAADIRLLLQTNSGGSDVTSSIIASQLNSYDPSSSDGTIANRKLTFTYTISADDDSNDSGYLVHSLHYDDSGFARYGILDAYGNGINADDLSQDIASLGISTGAIDTVMPYIDAVSIQSAPSNSLYGALDIITFEVNLSEQASTTQSTFEDQGLRFKIVPPSGEDIYRVAAYANSQTDQQSFSFTYVVGSIAGESDKGDVYLSDITLLGATYDTALNLESDLGYSGPGGSANDSGYDVDSGVPIVEALSIEYQAPADLYEAIQEGAEYTLGIGTALRFSLTFDEAISFDVNSSGAAIPYLELKAVDTASSSPELIRADLTSDSISTIGNGSSSVIAFTFTIGQDADNNASTAEFADSNQSQQSLYNYLEVFALQNADQIQDSAANALFSGSAYPLSGDSLATVHFDGADPAADPLGDTMIYIDSVRPQLSLLALDKSSGETYGAGADIALTR